MKNRQLYYLSTTQRYLGTISGIEAIRWIENIHGYWVRGGLICRVHPIGDGLGSAISTIWRPD